MVSKLMLIVLIVILEVILNTSLLSVVKIINQSLRLRKVYN